MMVYNPFIVVEIWTEALDMIAELPRRWDVQGSDPLNLPGVCQVTVSLSDPIMTRHPTLLNMNNWVKYTLHDGLGHSVVLAMMHIRKRRTVYVGSNEAGDYFRTVSGPTIHGTLADFIVKHQSQPPRQDASETRSYSWTAPSGEWFDTADWNDTITSVGIWKSHITNQRSGTTAKPKYKPQHWPDKDAEWVHVTGGGQWQFYRGTVTIPAGGLLVKWVLTADEIVRGFLDGDLVISRDEYETGYKGFGEYKTSLPEGDHVLGVMMRAKDTPGGDGIDAWLSSMFTLTDEDKVDTVLKRSQVLGWKAHAGLPAPGWNPAEILRSIVGEAQIRGNFSSTRFLVDFSDTEDSDSVSWGSAEINRNISIGTSALDAQSQLSELGNFDVWVDPDNTNPNAWPLKAFKRRGSDKSTAIALHPGRNLVGWEVEEVDAVGNVALIQYDGGWLEKTNLTSTGEFGEREIGISLGNVSDDATADTIASAHIESRKSARKRAGAADNWETDEDKQPLASIVPTPNATPFLDFGTGDSLKVPNESGVHVKQRLMSLTFTEDNTTGVITFDPEFAEED